jgi:hypothetical protein
MQRPTTLQIDVYTCSVQRRYRWTNTVAAAFNPATDGRCNCRCGCGIMRWVWVVMGRVEGKWRKMEPNKWRQPAASAAAWFLVPLPAAAAACRSASACSISAREGIVAPKEPRYSRKNASSFLCRNVGLFLRIPTAWRSPRSRRSQLLFGSCLVSLKDHI